MKKRNSNIELLRIIAMIMIILGHCNIYGNFDIHSVHGFFNKFIIGNTYLGNLGVIIFIITTGYFMIERDIQLKKIILFELQVLFYSVGIYVLFGIIGVLDLNLSGLFNCFFPVMTKQYWFFSVYIIFYFFIPYINKLILSLTKKELKKYMALLIIFVSIIPTFLSLDILKNEFLQFLLFYSLGAYININSDYYKNNNKVKYTLFLGVLSLFIYTSGIIIFSNYNINILNKIFFFSYRSSILMVIIAICLVITFLNFKFFSSKIINNISSCVFGIYLIHDNPNMRNFMWNSIFVGSEFANSNNLIIYMIFTVTIIFFGSLFVELVRKYTVENLNIKCVNLLVKKQKLLHQKRLVKY